MTFDEAIALAAAGDGAGGIGILKEKMLHATLKWWLDGDSCHHEIPLPSGLVADIFDGERIMEIQTANFSGFREKLARLLEQYPVTVVHPLVRRKWITWVDPATGVASEPHRSPRTGTFTDAGKELVYILPLLGHENLTVRLVLLDVEERRLADGWSRDGKRGSHRLERVPLELGEERILSRPADYRGLIPPALPAVFTAKAFGKAAHMQGRNLNGTLKVLLATGVLRREQKQGNAWLYQRV